MQLPDTGVQFTEDNVVLSHTVYKSKSLQEFKDKLCLIEGMQLDYN